VRHPLLLVLGLALSACVPATGATRSSPHGSTTACLSCHVDTSGTTFIGGSDTASCKTCHADEPHQVGIPPVRAHIPELFPLVDGKVACQTCHDEPACDGSPMDPANPDFFRGGPYPKIGQLCAQCHQETALDRFDPHTAMRSELAATRDDACLYCHETKPEDGAARESLKLPGVDTCRSCHFESSHAGSGEHMIELDAKTAAKATKAGLPLAEGDRVTCATCHDPHPSGTTESSKARADWSQERAVSEPWERDVLRPALLERAGSNGSPVLTGHDMLRLSLGDGSLCWSCHDAGPSRKGEKR